MAYMNAAGTEFDEGLEAASKELFDETDNNSPKRNERKYRENAKKIILFQTDGDGQTKKAKGMF